MDLRGLRAVVVGGASGMARATAELIVARGGRIAILDLATSDGATVAASLRGSFHACDVTDFDGTEAVLEGAVAALDGIDVVVNTAGGALLGRTLGRNGPLPLAAFRKVIDLNVVGTFNVARLCAWHMSRNKPNGDGERGVIINTASIAAFEGQVGYVAYSVAKGGVAAMSLSMARDLGGLGIRVNAIAPSLFRTGQTVDMPAEYQQALTKDAAFPRRLGRPGEYALLAVGIIENPMLNGSTIRLDAGQRLPPK
ncbi:SDR family NAD(P)-dependent oxidoreductase [Pseudofrankia inefficax]|uniref:Short-chain dehydrogenase/reductase SDR n=1 Tax=Pseudofrankia inefficax (strain DSM 45817 / CECT 9037 / DDB 130130 / EuI1c) TaxID=298654 RepID=E3J6I8_PSEI1|nr:SDR family NAD(P)-dependent oxidoreductase [Pseudofrankia inefficax]ADP80764.1 short-chain dehydrogenase/reductase SDR [Pseudofrankia inefficax]